MADLPRPTGTAEDMRLRARHTPEPLRYELAALNQPMQDTFDREDADVVGE